MDSIDFLEEKARMREHKEELEALNRREFLSKWNKERKAKAQYIFVERRILYSDPKVNTLPLNINNHE